MTPRLFVYGTLAPGKPNERILAKLDGYWEEATITGTLIPQGWGAAQGYPGVILSKGGKVIKGLLFTSQHLTENWPMLDEFEGAGYERVTVPATRKDGSMTTAFIYALRDT